MKPILEIRDLGKRYRIRHLAGGYLSLREQLLRGFEKETHEEFWALQNVRFDVSAGESVGIIGKNGAGKSTLLKILSKITPPTKGSVVMRGRVASLLEVGTGFHPELTGRENVFFNGSLLGMRKKEIERKFDEIVDFSGTEKFLDTALKHFSSGMQLRLAFAVAAFLEPEILVIDEVLAVGDAEFQKKCTGKMAEVTKSGRTILFVSHNMQALGNLCTKGIYLKNGEVAAIGTIPQVVGRYLSEGSNGLLSVAARDLHLNNDPDFRLEHVAFLQHGQPVASEVVNGEELVIEIEYTLTNRLSSFRIFLDVCDAVGTVLFRTFHDEQDGNQIMMAGRYMSRLTIPPNLLAPVSYDFRLLFGIHNIRMMEPKEGLTFRINVIQTGLYNKAYAGKLTAGSLSPVLPWQIMKR